MLYDICMYVIYNYNDDKDAMIITCIKSCIIMLNQNIALVTGYWLLLLLLVIEG